MKVIFHFSKIRLIWAKAISPEISSTIRLRISSWRFLASMFQLFWMFWSISDSRLSISFSTKNTLVALGKYKASWINSSKDIQGVTFYQQGKVIEIKYLRTSKFLLRVDYGSGFIFKYSKKQFIQKFNQIVPSIIWDTE
jgi:hypothetical protein